VGKPRFERRITMRTLGTTPEQLEAVALEQDKEVAVVRIVGRISSMEAASGNLGPYIKFRGDFAAYNLITDEETRGSTLILNGPGELLLQRATESAKKEDPKAVAQFGLDVTVKPHKSSYEKGWKFKYGVRALSDIPMEDSLSLLCKEFGALPLLTDKSKGKKAK
jgi:hypothetical protein